MKLKKKPNQFDDWSCVEEVIVVYPSITITTMTKRGFRTYTYKQKKEPKREIRMHYHGRTHKNPDHLIVETPDGWIHVVRKDLVWLEVK